jgi:hypothetical protein
MRLEAAKHGIGIARFQLIKSPSYENTLLDTRPLPFVLLSPGVA